MANYRDAARRWYGQVYRPLWHRVRERRLTRYFPGDRSADFVARLGAWRAESMENGASENGPTENGASTNGASALSWDEALDQFVATLRAGNRG